MKKIVILVFALGLVFSCKNENKTTVKEETIEVKDTPKITLQVVNGGDITVNKLEAFSDSLHLYQGQSKVFVDPIYIITHQSGKRMIWDTGLPEAIGSEPVTPGDGTFTIARKDSIGHQLKTLDLTYEDFDYIGISHIHFDHTGTANYFKNATWLVQENEYDFITSPEQATGLGAAVSELKNVQKLNGDHDVFGDGSVIIKSTPGHTIGHQSLYLDLGLERPILLTGDLYHFQENRQSKVSPSFNYDFPQTRESMAVFEAFAKEKNAEVIIQHSPMDLTKLQNILK
ncbi:N-acyl homoserine lactonase family protein [Winogradskyella immobilis]|uniref:N-acyl homoserine lactonase family protein n=1 Tax=Winogradskyella immobilis TaxID=2816852 RepID=A0ABS8EK68_9FLAO|nr:N-acyl homoserine lactonase family protein [Winogradskyella immobilis]MCC1483326.1 N-acyl homoserine lactonase family protein [Winogradskyella immobilis]MCG0015420.1 N-acyl homoserine lactonase family protein [Winogradskyella immobilis]